MFWLGFQGISRENRITTLGRGGSDTTAVALAVATKSNCCEIFTDVEGIFSSDPRIVKKAKKLKKLLMKKFWRCHQQDQRFFIRDRLN